MCLSFLCVKAERTFKIKIQIDWTLKKIFTTYTCYFKVSLYVLRFSNVQKRILILEQLGEESVTG